MRMATALGSAPDALVFDHKGWPTLRARSESSGIRRGQSRRRERIAAESRTAISPLGTVGSMEVSCKLNLHWLIIGITEPDQVVDGCRGFADAAGIRMSRNCSVM